MGAARLAPYPTLVGLHDELEDLTRRGRGEVVEVGRSVQGRPLLAARLEGRGERALLCSACIHGIEAVGAQVALGFLRSLVEGPSRARSLLDAAEIWVLPCINPDAYARTMESDGAESAADLRKNARGVDLNRNYPLPRGTRRLPLPGAGGGGPSTATYAGPEPLSEPESRAVAELCARQSFWAAANLHSFLGALIPAHTRHPADHRTYRALCRSFRGGQRWHRYPTLASRWLDGPTGEQEDFQHHHHGTWGVCVETFSVPASLRQHLHAPSPFWRFNPRDPSPWVEDDVPALVELFHAALAHERPTGG